MLIPFLLAVAAIALVHKSTRSGQARHRASPGRHRRTDRACATGKRGAQPW